MWLLPGGNMMAFLTERVCNCQYVHFAESTFSQIFPLSHFHRQWPFANGQAYVLAPFYFHSALDLFMFFRAQVASTWCAVDARSTPMLRGSLRCGSLPWSCQTKKDKLTHHPALSMSASFASSSSSPPPSSSTTSTEDPFAMDIYFLALFRQAPLHSSSIKQWSHGWGWSSLRAPSKKGAICLPSNIAIPKNPDPPRVGLMV